MEHCTFLKRNDPVPETRVYIGHVSCPDFLQESDWMLALSCPVTLVLPPLRETWLTPALRLAEALAEKNPALELSAGDLGTLSALHGLLPEIPLAAGPLLFPQDTDPLISDFCTPKAVSRPVLFRGVPAVLHGEPPSERCLSHWSEPSVFLEEELLRSLGVTRLEICTQPLGPRKAPTLPVTVYDRSFLTVLPCRRCEDCRRLPAAKRGNALLYPDKNLIFCHQGSIPPFADRVVTM